MTDKMVIRPSSLDTFFGCSHQWYRVFVLGQTSMTNNRAAIGTAIHKGAEVLWSESMKTKKKDPNVPKLIDAAIAEFAEEDKKHDVQYGEGEDINTSNAEIIKGVEAFVEDIVPFTAIPDKVEQRYTIDIDNHPLVKAVSGTVDYLSDTTMADIKTSKRKPTPASYEVQQSVYKMLVVESGQPVERNLIQGVVLKKATEGTILEAPTNLEKAKYLVNNLLDVTELLHTDKIDPNVLFRGNPKHHFCSPKFCAFYNDCKFVKGDAPEQNRAKVSL